MKLVKILSDKVQIRSDYKEFDDVRINDLIAVSDGEVELVTMVNTLTDIDTENEEEIGENDYILEHSSTKMLECSIIGTVKDGTFQKAIDKYPTMKVSAHRISKEEFASMLSRYTEGFCIGEYSAYEFPAYVDGNKFFQRHACIVGNTGAGKSETVAKILEQTSKLPGANVIVFDIHGEYKELSYARNIQIGGDRPFPIWMFGFTDMISNILKIKEESATVAMTALRKCYYNVCPKGKENRPVYFNYVEFVKLMKFLDEEMVGTGEVYKTGAQAGKEKIVKGDYNGKLTNIVNLLVDKARDSKYQFLFEDMPQQYLYDFMKDVLNNDVPVKNVYDSLDKNAYLFLPENEEMFGEMKEIPTGLDTLLLYSCSFEYNKDNTLTDSCFMDRTDNTIKLSELIAEDPKKATENPEDSSMLNNQFAAVLDDDSLSNVLLLNNEISWKKVASKKALPDDTMIRNLSSLQTLRVTAQNGTEKDSDKYQINKGKKKQKVYGSNILAGVAYRKIMNNARDNKGESANTLKDYKTYVVTDEEGKMLVEFSERYAITQASSTDQQTACMRLLWVMLSEAGQTQKNQQQQTTYPIMRSVFEKFQTYNAGYEGFSELEQARTQCITTGPNNRELLRFVSGIGKKQKVEGIKKYTDSYAEN